MGIEQGPGRCYTSMSFIKRTPAVAVVRAPSFCALALPLGWHPPSRVRVPALHRQPTFLPALVHAPALCFWLQHTLSKLFLFKEV